jgi:trans-2,3-dihydro-3-hydroxyanthranilate isomerase
MEYFITDVFGEKKYSGNQLATFFEFGTVSEDEMQQIAREINYSETTFITCGEKINNGYDVRIFTPASEIEFAGHPTLGTAFIIDKYLEKGKSGKLLLNLRAGQIPVTKKNGFYWMKHNTPTFKKRIDPSILAGVLSISEYDIIDKFPVQEVSTGLPVTIVPLKSMAALKRASISKAEYEGFIEEAWGKVILVFSRETYSPTQSLAVRVFVDYLGIPEDPATGSAMGCLAAYLLNFGVLGKKRIEISVGQGYEIDRPSNLYIEATREGNEFDINVGGKVFEIARGIWGQGTVDS